MKAIGYMRLSFKDQSKYSLDAQEAAIRAYCIKHQLELIALFTDNGQRSSTFERLDFKALETFVKKHKGLVRYLIIMEHDRFSRDLSEALSKINKLEAMYALKVIAVDESLDLDASDPSVFINRAFKYATANAELLNIRARTKRGIKNAQLQGRFINKAPFGYKNGKDLAGKSVLNVVVLEAAVIREIFRLYLSSLSISDITTRARDLGLTLNGHNAIGRILGNCLYAGLIKVVNENKSEKYVKALHESIISEADFWLVQEMRKAKKPLKVRSTRNYPLKGLLKCHCGKYMTAGWSKGNRKYYLYYHCKLHRRLNVPGAMVHEQFLQVLEQLILLPGQLSYLNQAVNMLLEIALLDGQQYIDARQKLLKDLDRKMEHLEEHLIDKHIDVSIFRKWSERYQNEKIQLLNQIENLKKEIKFQREMVQQFMKKLNNVLQIYEQCTPIFKQMLLKQIFKYGFTYLDGILKTYKICLTLTHNNATLRENHLLDIQEDEIFYNESEEGKFLDFVAKILLDVLTESNSEASENANTFR